MHPAPTAPSLHLPAAPPLVWLNGRLLPTSQPLISATDPGFLLGLGVFETLAFRSGSPLALNRHFSRLQSSAAALGLEVPHLDRIRAAVSETALANRLPDARIRITATGDPASPTPSSTLISAVPLTVPHLPSTAILAPFRRNPASPLSGIKSTSYAENILALRFAKSQGADEAILCDSSGNLSEATSANLFFASSGILHTPPLSSGCLPGITRQLLLELCQKHAIPCQVAPSSPDDLLAADEAFLTSSIRGVHPLASIDGNPLPLVPGPVTSLLKRLLGELFDSTPDP